MIEWQDRANPGGDKNLVLHGSNYNIYILFSILLLLANQ